MSAADSFGAAAAAQGRAARLLAAWRGAFTLTPMMLNTVFWAIPLLLLAMIKLLTPVPVARESLTRALAALAENWISTNNAILGLTRALKLEQRGDQALERREWYLMISNHRSWIDVLVLQAAFNRRIPFLKFFIKEQLRWIPLLGLAWWALDMPFMRRHSREYLAQHPEARGQDLEATRRACENFRRTPTTVINFVEGTRYSPAKRDAVASPYRHLLPPRAGGMAFVLGAMGDMLHATLDVTIAYGARIPSLWDLCCGRLERVIVHVRRRAIEPWMIGGSYSDDTAFRTRFQQGLGALWAEKDDVLGALQTELE
jgi:1-acyl-sn-glycerol-3-phosphate acyltransferase